MLDALRHGGNDSADGMKAARAAFSGFTLHA
jgi:hypothetical protein